MTHAGSLLRACAIAVAVSTCAPATALAASAQDSAVAQSLYDQARTLAAAGNWADACGKFEESQRLDPTPVTEFHLADCYEHAGRTASAWTTFLDLATTARAAKRADREKAATDRATALEPKLTRLVVDVPPGAQVPDLVVRRDGEAVGRGQWGTPVPVDPGKHTVEAKAPGKRPFSVERDVSGVGQTVTIAVDALVDEPVATGPAPATPAVTEAGSDADAPRSSSPLKTVGLVVGGVGVVGVAVGAVFGVLAISKNSDANGSHCGSSAGFGSPNQCDSTGVSLRSTAVSDGNLSTIGVAAGAVLLAGGGALWFLAPSGHVAIAPTVGMGSAGAILRGDF
jgi:hypothetical protein